jgi:hypothetical protein
MSNHPDENMNLAKHPDAAKTVAELRQQPDRSLPGK